MLTPLLAWVVYGVTVVGIGEMEDNPPPNTAGVIDEVASLPYLVPDGFELVIDSMGIEGPGISKIEGSQIGMALWLGEMPCTNEKSLMSVTTPAGSVQLTDMKWRIPAGSLVNIHLMNNSAYPWANAWYVQGDLVPSP